MTATSTNSPPAIEGQILSDVEIAALHVAVGKLYTDSVKDRLPASVRPGEAAAVDLTLRITGAIQVGADKSYEKTKAPKLDDAVAKLLATAESLLPGMAKKLVDMAGTADAPVPRQREHELATAFIAATSTTYTQLARGSLTGAVSVEQVQSVPVPTGGRTFR